VERREAGNVLLLVARAQPSPRTRTRHACRVFASRSWPSRAHCGGAPVVAAPRASRLPLAPPLAGRSQQRRRCAHAPASRHPGRTPEMRFKRTPQTPTMRERARRRATRNGRPRWERPLALVGARAPGPGTPKGRGAAPRVRMRSWSARRVIIRALGRERPVSMKLRCRAETCASGASSSWLSRRRVRHQRNRTPTRGARVGSMAGAVAQAPSSGDGASPVAVAARAGRGSSLRRTAA
jgi:hypothetical protein